MRTPGTPGDVKIPYAVPLKDPSRPRTPPGYTGRERDVPTTTPIIEEDNYAPEVPPSREMKLWPAPADKLFALFEKEGLRFSTTEASPKARHAELSLAGTPYIVFMDWGNNAGFWISVYNNLRAPKVPSTAWLRIVHPRWVESEKDVRIIGGIIARLLKKAIALPTEGLA